VRKRSQLSTKTGGRKTAGKKTRGKRVWTKRSRETGAFMAQKKTRKFKGVRREA